MTRAEATLAVALLTVGVAVHPACGRRSPPADTATAVRPAPPNCPACAMGLTATTVFERLDANGDKQITVAEFATTPRLRDEREAREAVGRIDTDKNGTLSWTEFETAYKLRHANCKKGTAAAGPLGRGNRTRFAMVFLMRNDRNGDGVVDRSEFRGAPWRFDRMDKNRNGQLDAEELEELHARRMSDPKSMPERLRDGDAPRAPAGARPSRDGSNAPDE